MMIAAALAGLAWPVFGVFGLRPVSAKSDAMPPSWTRRCRDTEKSPSSPSCLRGDLFCDAHVRLRCGRTSKSIGCWLMPRRGGAM